MVIHIYNISSRNFLVIEWDIVNPMTCVLLVYGITQTKPGLIHYEMGQVHHCEYYKTIENLSHETGYH